MTENRKAGALITVFLAVLIDLMGFGLVLPLLPFYASAFRASAVAIGMLYSVYSLAQLVFSPLWGSLSDRIGRRPVMLLSTMGASAAYVLFGLSHSLGLLFFSRLMAGIMGGNISTAQAYVADVTSHEDRAKGMGMIGAAFGIGFVLGPALATLMIHPSFLKFFRIAEENRFAIPGFFAAGMSLLSFLMVLLKLPESVKNGGDDPERIVRPGIFSASFWSTIFSRKNHGAALFPLLILCAFLLSYAQASLYSAFPLFCREKIGLSPEKVGMQFVWMGLIAILIQGGLMRRLPKIFGERRLFLTGSALMVLGFFLIPLAHTPKTLTLFLGVMAVGGSLNGPTLNSLISKEADPARIGATMGTAQGISGLGRVIGPTTGGFFYEINYFLPFLTTSAFLVITLFAGAKLLRRTA